MDIFSITNPMYEMKLEFFFFKYITRLYHFSIFFTGFFGSYVLFSVYLPPWPTNDANQDPAYIDLTEDAGNDDISLSTNDDDSNDDNFILF